MRHLVAGGVKQDRIAAMLGISDVTLRRHHKDAIRVGQLAIDALSIATLVTAMKNGGPDAVAAAIWWQKSRMGWSERTAVDEKPAETLRVIVELVGDPPTPVTGGAPTKPRPVYDMSRHVQLPGCLTAAGVATDGCARP